MDKKGSAEDVVFITVALFGVAIAMIVGYTVISQATTKVQSIPAYNQSSNAVAVLQASTRMISNFDYVTLAVFIGFMLTLMISAWFVDTHPIFIAVFFVMLAIAIVLASILGNAWANIIASSTFSTFAAQFPLTNNLMTHWARYITIVGLLGVIVIFGKPSIEGGGYR